MAKFRIYKNGIEGHRYKGYYITRNNNSKVRGSKLYGIVDDEKNIILQNEPLYINCEWEIDKMTASDNVMELYKALYDKEIYELQRMIIHYSTLEEEGTINELEMQMYEIVEKIRDRKVKKLPF